jgi:hypothetical protein
MTGETNSGVFDAFLTCKVPLLIYNDPYDPFQ